MLISVSTNLHRASLRDQALAVIREAMVSGELAPGGIYSATALATELGVSASPVREALLTLVNQGLMEPVRNRGFRVIPLSDNDRREIYDLRLMLEVPAMGRLAKEHQSEIVAHREEYESIADEVVTAARAGKIIDYLDADRRFHLGLLEFSDNQRMVSIIDGLRDHTRLFGLHGLSERGTLVASAEEHLPILTAIIDGDPGRTEELMLRHLDHIRGDWATGADE